MNWRFAIFVVAAAAAGCGYHVAGDTIAQSPAPAPAAGAPAEKPEPIRTIAVTAFTNRTIRYKLAQRLPADISHEFISRTRYKITSDPNTADAVLQGAVLQFGSYPIIADQASGRATVVQCSAFLMVKLTERVSGKVLFNRPWFEVRERYEISIDPQAYFDESGAAEERLSRDVARDVVTSILANF